MPDDSLHKWRHEHTFGQDERKPGERRTIIVIAITGAMMVVEIAAGVVFGSMALLADGLHMASHAAALSISAFAYIYARRHANNPAFSFGTGKVNALGGYTSAVLLAVFALVMAWESGLRLINPVEIAFNQAIIVAVLGLLVNGGCVLILGGRHDHHDHHDHSGHEHGGHHHAHPHEHHHHDHHHHDHHDHNLRAAYLHVLADALTSLLAIAALLGGKYMGYIWMDPLMGIVGALLVGRWSLGLLTSTSAVLLDRQGPQQLESEIRRVIEEGGHLIADLHVWSIGPDMYAAIISIVTREALPPLHFKRLLPPHLNLVHITVEVHESGEEFAQV